MEALYSYATECKSTKFASDNSSLYFRIDVINITMSKCHQNPSIAHSFLVTTLYTSIVEHFELFWGRPEMFWSVYQQGSKGSLNPCTKVLKSKLKA